MVNGRRSRLVVVSVGAAFLLMAGVFVVTGGSGASSERGHPLRIAHPYVFRDLPDRPGPLAGVVQRSDGSWLAISPKGRVWELRDLEGRFDATPALWDDGRRLGYLRWSEDGYGEYHIRDLTTGDVTAFPDVGSGATESDTPYWTGGQSPAYVSPDGRQVLIRGGVDEGRDPDGLLLGVDGGVREIFVRGATYPAGWLPDGTIAWLSLSAARWPQSRAAAILVTTDTGSTVRRLELALTRPMDLTQWSARVSPDGRQVALGQEGDGLRGIVARFSMHTGRELAREGPIPDSWLGTCPPGWRGDQVVVPTTTGDESTASTGAALVDSRGAPIVLADPRLDVACSLWAPQALSGDVHRGLSGRLFGTSRERWTWWWRELTATALLLGALGAGLWWRRRHPRSSGGCCRCTDELA